MNDLIIRKAKIRDIDTMRSVIEKSILATHTKVYPEKDMQETLDNYTIKKLHKYINTCDYYVAEYGSRVVGCVLTEKDGKMRSLYVLPSFMGKGIGRKLVERVEKRVREMGLNEIFLWSSLVSHDFYKHMGYEDVKDIENEEGLVLHVEMRKSLT